MVVNHVSEQKADVMLIYDRVPDDPAIQAFVRETMRGNNNLKGSLVLNGNNRPVRLDVGSRWKPWPPAFSIDFHRYANKVVR